MKYVELTNQNDTKIVANSLILFMLKKIFFSVLVLIITSGLIHSQSLEIRPQIGASYGLLNPAPEGASVHGKFSWQGGLDVLYGKRRYWQIGVQYHQFRSAYSYPGNTGGRVDFIGERYRVLLNGGLRLMRKTPKSKINVRIFGGVAAYYLTNIRSKLSNSNLSETNQNDVNPLSGAINYGVGVDFFRFFIEASGESGFSNFFKNASYGNSKSDAYFLTIGLRFRIKNRIKR